MDYTLPFEDDIEPTTNDNDKGSPSTLPRIMISPALDILNNYFSFELLDCSFESDEEKYFTWMLEELKEAGYVIEWGRPNNSFFLSQQIKYTKETKRKTLSNKIEERELLAQHVYTPDYVIIWDVKAVDLFVHVLELSEIVTCPFYGHYDASGYVYSIIEIKPVFDRHNMTREFTINKKWVYQTYGVYIDLIKVPLIFKQFFLPKHYLFTDKNKVPRKINFKFKTFKEYCHDNKIS